MILNETFRLSNGVEIPKLGLGTWMIEDGNAAEAVRNAVKLGYRHIDSAQGYGNERGVGEGIRSCGLPREDIFVTTKIEADIKDYKGAVDAINGSLTKMGLDYIDMMIIHSPQPWKHFREGEHWFEGNLQVWKALEEAYNVGKLRAIGVSNFEEIDLKNILDHCTVRPMVNQVLAHISNTPFSLIDFCKKENILVEAYSPVGHGEMFKNATVAEIAGRYGVSIPRLCIRYCLQLGLLPLPKTANPAHMADNADVDFEISESDIQTLKGLEQIKNYGDASVFPVYGGKI